LIKINGREINLDNLRVKVERRRVRGLLREEEEQRIEQAGLERSSSLDAQTYFGVQYRMEKEFDRYGAHLEPPLDYGKGSAGSGRPWSKPLRLWRKIRRKAITGPGEGYLYQQELFNNFAVKGLQAATRLFQSFERDGEQGPGMEAPAVRDSAELRGEEAVSGLLAGTHGRLAFIGLPGTAALERILEQGRLLVGIDLDDEVVAAYQAQFLPARWQHPLDFVRGQDFSGCGAVVVNCTDRLSVDDLDQLVAAVAERLPGEAEVLLRVSRDGWLSPRGLVRAASSRDVSRWTAEYLAWLLERHGYSVRPVEWGGACFLQGASGEVVE
jgi:hypothetical protein